MIPPLLKRLRLVRPTGQIACARSRTHRAEGAYSRTYFTIAAQGSSSASPTACLEPGRNVTGSKLQANELSGKRLELNKEVVPAARGWCGELLACSPWSALLAGGATPTNR